MAAADPAMTPSVDPTTAGRQPHGRRPGPAADAPVVFALDGRLDALRALPLRAELDELVVQAAAGARDVVVDLRAVTFVDSAALAALVRLRRQCADTGLDLKFVKPRHVDALRIFRLTQFDEVFVMIDGTPG